MPAEYRYGIPLIIQDKTFVPDTSHLMAQDPTWDKAKYGDYGNLWLPHVYMPNQNPWDFSGANPMGRWDYALWFFPPYTGLLNHGTIPNPLYGPTNPTQPPDIPGTPNPSLVPEAFVDTPVINGAAYPYVNVERRAYRFRILNAANDRFWNLQLYYADPAHPTEVKMVPSVNTGGSYPASWPSDGRAGGVPDPATVGPEMIQIGTEGGFLPAPVVLPNTPIGYNYNRRDIVVLNVENKTLFMGPAERADVIVDFSQVPANSTIILYNDAPAPVPAFDPRNDYYTGDPDNTDIGGAPSTLAGKGPNTAPAFNLAALQNTTTGLPHAYAISQAPPVVPQAAYGLPNGPYNSTYTDAIDKNFSSIQGTTLTFAPFGLTTPSTVNLKPKAIQELFETNYGRMNATLGVELPFTNANNQTTIPYGYIDPFTETTSNNETQIWKITHNGVDTHAIHFHLFNVQLINRVGWDGAIRPPDSNELGWKETVRMNPLEDAIVAIKPVTPRFPFIVPDSIRPLDPTQPIGSTMNFWPQGPNGLPVTTVNQMTNFGWEYVWHCHLLGHEENDMMRPLVFNPHAKTDILFRNTSTGDTVMLYMDGITPTGADSIFTVADTNWKIVGRGDFNRDGKPDILWRNTSTGQNVVTY
ncbi:MAG: multicopper oxidase domain-containing protein, partial [Deltaproteobacteria bacterium]|nr:multicopper oxidase domain-containing protein [Deltaproteobacteria bacterium]